MNSWDHETTFVRIKMHLGRSNLKEVWRMNKTSIREGDGAENRESVLLFWTQIVGYRKEH